MMAIAFVGGLVAAFGAVGLYTKGWLDGRSSREVCDE
jgi:hypothetical protein